MPPFFQRILKVIKEAKQQVEAEKGIAAKTPGSHPVKDDAPSK